MIMIMIYTERERIKTGRSRYQLENNIERNFLKWYGSLYGKEMSNSQALRLDEEFP